MSLKRNGQIFFFHTATVYNGKLYTLQLQDVYGRYTKAELCELIDRLNERIAECEEQLKCVSAERDEALAALAALREALAAIRKLTEI